MLYSNSKTFGVRLVTKSAVAVYGSDIRKGFIQSRIKSRNYFPISEIKHNYSYKIFKVNEEPQNINIFTFNFIYFM